MLEKVLGVCVNMEISNCTEPHASDGYEDELVSLTVLRDFFNVTY